MSETKTEFVKFSKLVEVGKRPTEGIIDYLRDQPDGYTVAAECTLVLLGFAILHRLDLLIESEAGEDMYTIGRELVNASRASRRVPKP